MGTVPAEDRRGTRLTGRHAGPDGTGPVSRAGSSAAMISPSCQVCARAAARRHAAGTFNVRRSRSAA